MTILAFETSHSAASVALYIDNTIYEKKISSDKRHEETVMPAVAELMCEHGLRPSDLDIVAVDIGPGSFTGIRIGICHANAIADAADIPCVGVCSLEAMAFPYKGKKMISTVIDAGNGNCYGAVFDKDLKPVYVPSADSLDSFMLFSEKLNPEICVKDTEGFLPSAYSVAKIVSLLDQTLIDRKMRAQPMYLRPSQAERKYLG